MKYSKLVVVFFMGMFFSLSAQNAADQIFLTNGETVAAKVKKVSPNTITYSYIGEELKLLVKQIDEYLTSSSSYTKTDLTILDIARSVNIHPKSISAAINTVRKQNFNTYINQHRINKAITLLKNNADLNLSIEGIGKEVGFHSKSSFYSAFKKITGTTPTKFKANVAA